MSANEPSRRDAGEARLWHIGTALAVSFAGALLGLAALAWLAWFLLGLGGFRRHGTPPLHDTVGVLQLVFASVAGAGALVALIVAYRRQKVAESAAALDRASAQLERTRVYNERFTAAAAQIGDEKPAIRLAGVHAMAGLADDWPENRQTCVDVLCAYLRMPYEPDPGEKAPMPERLAFRADREVRHTVIRVITAHLQEEAAVSWQGLNLDFTGVVFDGGDFRRAEFSSGEVVFRGAEFSGGEVDFRWAEFSGGEVDFGSAQFSGGAIVFRAKFSGGKVVFDHAQFSGGKVVFDHAQFSGATVDFRGANFSGSEVHFRGANFSGGEVVFRGANFSALGVLFGDAEFSGATVDFGSAEFSGSTVEFEGAKFSSGTVEFDGAEFSGGEVYFIDAKFSGGRVVFRGAQFSGGQVYFDGAQFSGAQVDFSHARDWSVPPAFDWPGGSLPQGVRLPAKQDQPQP